MHSYPIKAEGAGEVRLLAQPLTGILYLSYPHNHGINSMTTKTYNGYTNYETWNAALWINNDEGINLIAQDYENYSEFAKAMTHYLGESETGDGVKWLSSKINRTELTQEIFKPFFESYEF